MNRNASILQFFSQQFTFRHKISTMGALLKFYIWTKTIVDSGWYLIKFGLGTQNKCIFGIFIPMAQPTNSIMGANQILSRARISLEVPLPAVFSCNSSFAKIFAAPPAQPKKPTSAE